MMCETFWIIYAIFFWVIIALLVISFFTDTFIRFMYYKWDKQSRDNELIENKVGEIIEEKIDLGGGIKTDEN